MEALLQDAPRRKLSHADFLEQVLTEEVSSRTSRGIAMHTRMAHFPFVKPREAFDFAYQRSSSRRSRLVGRPRRLLPGSAAILRMATCSMRRARLASCSS